MALPARECARNGCSVMFEPERASAKYCGGPCRAQAALDRKQARRMAGQPETSTAPAPDPVAEEIKAREEGYRSAIGPIMEITRARLAKAGVEDSELAGPALALAYRIQSGYAEGAAALGSLIKAHREALAAAVAASEETESAAVAARRSAQAKIFRLAAARAS